MRLIDADAFKNYIRSALDDMRHLFKDNGEWAEEVTEEFCKDIDEQPTIEQPHWIPCSERMPEKNCRCLTTNDTCGIGMFEVDCNAWINGRWLYANDNPVAWMRLPEPYGGEGNV